ncbi:MAG: hypothetical protein AB1599_05060 [Planctomycetota bacterium]
MRKPGYMPRKDQAFFSFQGNLNNTVVANAVAWGIPPAAVTAFTASRTAYEPIYTKSQDKGHRTQQDVSKHRAARKVYQKEIEVFVNTYLRFNPLVTDDEMAGMKIPRRDFEPSPHPPIDDIPLVGLRAQGGGDLEFRIRVTEDKTLPSMHPAANLIELRFVILEQGDIPPADENDFTKKEVSSRAKFTLALGLKSTGKKFWGIFRWVNTHKPRTAGHWTEPISVIIA